MLNEFATNYPTLAQTIDALALLLLPAIPAAGGYVIHRVLAFFGQ